MMVLGATDRLSCIVSLSKFYSSGDPLFLGHSPSPAFSGRSMSQFPTNELFLVPTDFRAISRPMWCLQSNRILLHLWSPTGFIFGPILQFWVIKVKIE
jgi:hypothetical protein